MPIKDSERKNLIHNNILLTPNLNILQLCSYYTGNKVHSNLFRNLDYTLDQHVFVGVRSIDKIGKNKILLQKGTLKYDKIWSWYHRIFYISKIKKALNKIKPDQLDFDLVHAHTWFSDGGTAFLINKKFNKPYIITVRNTDINLFYNKLVYLRKYGHSILESASKIVFVSPAYQKKLIEKLPHKIKNLTLAKSIIIPNGIDDYWFNNLHFAKEKQEKKTFNLLFVGSIIQLKNIERLVDAFLKFNKEVTNSTLKLIGFKNKGSYEQKIRKKYEHISNIKLMDQISEKQELLAHYRNSDIFIMPSLTETFGLVYIEALTQGLPIIYSKGHGVDGYFDSANNGIGVNPESEEEISDAIFSIYKNYNSFLVKDQSYLNQFKWEDVSEKYIDLYTKLNKHKK